MKKCLSLLMCLVMLLSVFSVCGLVASAANAGDVLTVKATEVTNGKVTYNVYLNANTPTTGVILRVEFDNSVLAPAKSTFEDEGAFMLTDEYGDKTANIGGTYAGGMVANSKNIFSVAFVSVNEYKSSSQKGMFSITFDVIDAQRPVTEVEFYCVEFASSNEKLNIGKNEANPQMFHMVQTNTFEKTVIKSVTLVQNGMKVTWEPTEGADYYNFYKKTSSGWKVTKLPVTTTSFVDTTASHGVKETYAVRAFKNDGTTARTYNKITGLYVAPPAKVTASNAANGVKVSWSAVSGADSYRVFKRVVNADGTKGDWQHLVKNTTAKSATDTAVKSNVRYEYLVRTYMDGVYSANSVVGAVNYYAAPTVKLSNATNGVKITWNKIAGAESYRIYRKYSGASGWTVLDDVSADTLQFVDKKATSCKTIYYAVRAFTESDGSSSYVAQKLVYVATPKLTSIANTRSGIQVKWSAIKGATGYRVYRKAGGATSWTYLTTVKTTYYNDKNVKSGTNYTYTVKAVYGKAVSAHLSGISIKYLATPALKKVANVSAGIQFNWGAVGGASGYRVYRKTGSGSWQPLGITKNAYYVDKNVKNGTYYTYTVKAYNGKTVSGYNTSGLKIKCS